MSMAAIYRVLGAAALLLWCAGAPQAQQQPGAYSAVTPSPVVPNYNTLIGSYSKGITSGVIGAGASASAPVFSLRYAPTNIAFVAVIKNVQVSVADAGTGFAAGTATLGLYAARAFTASDTGGTACTLTGNNGKLRTSFATTGIADCRVASTAALTAGTRTLDTDPLGAVTAGVVVAAGSPVISPGTVLFSPNNSGDYPLVLANNEGFVIQATVPATGTWTISVYVEWDEYGTY